MLHTVLLLFLPCPTTYTFPTGFAFPPFLPNYTPPLSPLSPLRPYWTPMYQIDAAISCSLHSKRRKARTVFSWEQLKVLEETFEKKRYVSVKDRVVIAAQLGLTEQNVKTWFQNRRTKWKKEQKLENRQSAEIIMEESKESDED